MTTTNAATAGRDTGMPTPIAELFAEAERQLNICNACRYCEGYCAVFPALERRTILTPGDISHLANLCHDCRACLYACMYAPPHEFAINPPKILSELRTHTWDEGVATPATLLPARKQGRRAALTALIITTAIIVALTAATEGLSHLWTARTGPTSPYAIISYPALLAVMTAPFLWAAIALVRAAGHHWQHTRGPLRDLWNLPAWKNTIIEAGQLRYLKGGGADCQYPTQTHSPIRRRLHAAIAYGFTACLISTISAGIYQDIVGTQPPYHWASIPVITGTLGGTALVIGSIGLTILKSRTDPEATDKTMTTRDYNLLAALTILGTTGLATLATRTTTTYGIILTIHLATVSTAFAITPYTKFNHATYRLLALLQDNIERNEEAKAE
jgi:citrate/tricarballylate utilization protein